MSADSSETSSYAEESWIQWFINLTGNHLFCEVDKSFIEDSFNLFGLKQYVHTEYSKALDLILDRYSSQELENEDVSRAATVLYGLIHARYIITSHGLETMVIIIRYNATQSFEMTLRVMLNFILHSTTNTYCANLENAPEFYAKDREFYRYSFSIVYSLLILIGDFCLAHNLNRWVWQMSLNTVELLKCFVRSAKMYIIAHLFFDVSY